MVPYDKQGYWLFVCKGHYEHYSALWYTSFMYEIIFEKLNAKPQVQKIKEIILFRQFGVRNSIHTG